MVGATATILTIVAFVAFWGAAGLALGVVVFLPVVLQLPGWVMLPWAGLLLWVALTVAAWRDAR